MLDESASVVHALGPWLPGVGLEVSMFDCPLLGKLIIATVSLPDIFSLLAHLLSADTCEDTSDELSELLFIINETVNFTISDSVKFT